MYMFLTCFSLEFTGWSFDVYDTYPNETQEIIKYYVPPGGDMILECDTIGHPKYTITKWHQATIDSDDIVLPNGNLLIRNFTHSFCVSYFCILNVYVIDSKSHQYFLCPKTGLCVCVCLTVCLCLYVLLSGWLPVCLYVCVYV